MFIINGLQDDLLNFLKKRIPDHMPFDYKDFTKESIIYGCYKEDVLIGIIRTRLPVSGGLFIAWMVIDKDHRGKGYGSRFYKKAEWLLKADLDVFIVILSVMKDNPKALAFWKKMGFKEDTEEEEEDDFLLMKFI